MLIYLATYSDLALLILRLSFGSILIARGFARLTSHSDAPTGAETNNRFFSRFLGAADFLTGAAIAVGFLINLAALVVVVRFLASGLRKILRGFSFVGGWDFDFLALGAALLLLSIGAGQYAADLKTIILYGS